MHSAITKARCSEMANKSVVQQQKNKQMQLTIPRAIAEAMRLKKGDEVEWIFDRGDVLVRKS
jgi:bifunctional DNA-binding transcriptional regulator/antitoxin component of YhaV-PrlF toxin-antitoxin module